MGGLRSEIAGIKREVATLAASAATPVPSPLELAQAAGLEPLSWQVRALRSQHPRQLYNAARQSGKSQTAAVLAVHEALSKPGSLTMLVSRTLDHSGELFRKALAVFKAVSRPEDVRYETQLSLELTNGSRIISRPGSSDVSVRGFSASLLIVDEASRVPDELYSAALPVLARSGGRLIALSTPFGRRGWWYHSWSEESFWEKYHVPAEELPPDWYEPSTPEFLESERLRMGEWWFMQEYHGVFMDSQFQLFSSEAVEAMFTDDALPELEI